ncbi:MAG: TIGR01777 family protein [Pseudobacteriovorax sp.]|nr:TIGR01777 family protein [Pseudobacteriovorax sp.]
MRIIVTGATGFIGRKLVHQLFGDGHDITVVCRNTAKAKRSIDLPLDYVEWKNPSSELRLPDTEFDGLINLAGENIGGGRWTEEVKKKLVESRVDFGRALIQTVQSHQTSQLKFAISASAVGIYTTDPSVAHDEEGAQAKGFLADLVRDWERVWTDECKADRLVQLRIGVVLGRDGGVLDKLKPVFQWGLGGVVGRGDQPFSWIHVDDLVRIIETSVTNEAYSGVINCVAPNPETNRSLTELLAKALGRPAIFPVPSIALKLMFGEMSQLVLEGQNVIPTRLEELGFSFDYPRISLALDQLFGKKKIGPNGEVMACESFEADQFIDKPLEKVFDFFSDPYNLEKITPPLLKFKIETISHEKVTEGTLITYRLRIHGIPIKWKTLIADWKENSHFVDLQLKGPYKIWHHTHTFKKIPKGTMMHDCVYYQIPFGALGNQVLGPFIRKDIHSIFSFRREVIADLLD